MKDPNTSPAIHAIADLLQAQGFTVYTNTRVVACEVEGCSAMSVNSCHWCLKAICQEHSHPSISDDNRDVFACPACFFDGT